MPILETLIVDRERAESMHRYCIDALRGKKFQTYPGNMLRFAYSNRDCMRRSRFHDLANGITREIGVFCKANKEELARARLNKKKAKTGVSNIVTEVCVENPEIEEAYLE